MFTHNTAFLVADSFKTIHAVYTTQYRGINTQTATLSKDKHTPDDCEGVWRMLQC